MKTVAVYVHGLWMTGWEGFLLRQRLAAGLGAETPQFFYPSVRADIRTNAGRLAARLRSLSCDTLHLVGHSLGGVLIATMFESVRDDLPPGRVVLMGSPLQGSRAAVSLARFALGRKIMGRGVGAELLNGRRREWNSARELGIIAGSHSVGLGRLVHGFSAASDGTVYVDETRMPGMKQHLVLPVTHTSMTFSADVSCQIVHFLNEGRFDV